MIKLFKMAFKSFVLFAYYLYGFFKSFRKITNPSVHSRISPMAVVHDGVYSVGKSTIGRHVEIGKGTYINSGYINNAIIGEYCSISYDVKIGMTEHLVNAESSSPVYMNITYGDVRLAEKKTKFVIVGDHTWIGANVIILQGVTIGAHSIIAAGAVVTKNVPNFEVWGGVPAKKIKKIGEEIGEENGQNTSVG